MSKYSVKKPLTIIVCVIIIIALGIVSVTRMTPDLLPSIDLPYMVVMTTYPGGTPEEVQEEVTKPLEQSLATLENLKTIQSISGNPFAGSAVQYIYGFPGTAAETLAQNYPAQFTFLLLTDAWYARLTE